MNSGLIDIIVGALVVRKMSILSFPVLGGRFSARLAQETSSANNTISTCLISRCEHFAAIESFLSDPSEKHESENTASEASDGDSSVILLWLEQRNQS